MLIKYQKFIDRNGKIVFPLYFFILLALFIILPVYCIPDEKIVIGSQIADMYNKSNFAYFYRAIASPITYYTNYKYLVGTNTYFAEEYPTFSDYFSADIFLFYVVSSILSIATVVCIIIFLCYYFQQKNNIKPFLFIVPLLYLIQTTVLLIVSSADRRAYTYIPFVPYYLIFIAFILALLYCIKPKKHEHKPHKLTKSERIAELEKQVADLQSKLPSGND